MRQLYVTYKNRNVNKETNVLSNEYVSLIGEYTEEVFIVSSLEEVSTFVNQVIEREGAIKSIRFDNQYI